MIFGDANAVDPLAQWGSIALQGGAFGLLTYIVVVFAPRVMKESRDEREERDKRFSSIIDTLHARFEDRNKELIASVKDQTQILATSLQSSSARIESAVGNACKHRSE